MREMLGQAHGQPPAGGFATAQEANLYESLRRTEETNKQYVDEIRRLRDQVEPENSRLREENASLKSQLQLLQQQKESQQGEQQPR